MKGFSRMEDLGFDRGKVRVCKRKMKDLCKDECWDKEILNILIFMLNAFEYMNISS